jgi:NitT/TauT family transport system ATP-binding protein
MSALTVLQTETGEAADGAAVVLDDVTKIFGSGNRTMVVLERLSLDVRQGELLCLLGASGCGKSTILNLMAGLETPTAGRVSVPAGRTTLMFQEAGLFPWLTAAENVGLPLRLQGQRRAQRDTEVRSLLGMVRLEPFAGHRPHQLSGGMRQRVALARALAQRGEVLLMDEPFAALDAITRDQLHVDLARVRAETGVTIVFVTHDVREAVRLGDRIALISSRPGRLLEEFVLDGDRSSPAAHEKAAATIVPQITDLIRQELRRHGSG